MCLFFFFFSSRRRHTRYWRDWNSDVCSSDLARTIVDSAAVARVRINLYTNLDHSDSAVEVGLEYLRRIDEQWSPHPTEQDVRQEFGRLWQRLRRRSILAILGIPPVCDLDPPSPA